MRYCFSTHKETLDKIIRHLRTGVPLNNADRMACAEVLGALRDYVASNERRVSSQGRKTARDLSQAMFQDISRGR